MYVCLCALCLRVCGMCIYVWNMYGWHAHVHCDVCSMCVTLCVCMCGMVSIYVWHACVYSVWLTYMVFICLYVYVFCVIIDKRLLCSGDFREEQYYVDLIDTHRTFLRNQYIQNIPYSYLASIRTSPTTGERVHEILERSLVGGYHPSPGKGTSLGLASLFLCCLSFSACTGRVIMASQKFSIWGPEQTPASDQVLPSSLLSLLQNYADTLMPA